MARNYLPLDHFEARRVLLPVREGEPRLAEAVEIVVFGANFPQRAIEPELLVGKQVAQRVAIARDQRSLRGYLQHMPQEGDAICVRYGDSLEGTLDERFSPRRVRPLPKGCED
jgi:hypothetical protein